MPLTVLPDALAARMKPESALMSGFGLTSSTNHQRALDINNLAGNQSLDADGIAESGRCRDKTGTARPLCPATSLSSSFRTVTLVDTQLTKLA